MQTTWGMSNDSINKPAYKYKASTISNVLPHEMAQALKTHLQLHPSYLNKFVHSYPTRAVIP
jgi:hypothetical protein